MGLLARLLPHPFANRGQLARAALRGTRKVVASSQVQDAELAAMATYLGRFQDPSDAINIVDQIDAGIFLVDMKRRYAFVNAATCTALGYSVDELLGKPVAETATPEYWESMSEQYRLARDVRRYGWVRMTALTRRGEQIPFRSSGRLVLSGGLPYILAVVLTV